MSYLPHIVYFLAFVCQLLAVRIAFDLGSFSHALRRNEPGYEATVRGSS